jgi:hypothetical protein
LTGADGITRVFFTSETVIEECGAAATRSAWANKPVVKLVTIRVIVNPLMIIFFIVMSFLKIDVIDYGIKTIIDGCGIIAPVRG